MKTILITGGTGFLGSRIAKLLSEKGYTVLLLKNQKTEDQQNEIARYFKEHTIDAIIHTATCYGRNNESWAEIAEVNLALPIRLLVDAERAGVKLFINADTFFNDKIVFEGREHIYVKTKKDFLAVAQDNTDLFKITFANVKIEQMYGSNDGDGKFIPFIIRELLSSKEKIRLTPGEQKRDFISVNDVAQAFLHILEHYGTLSKYEEFGIGTGTSLSIQEVVSYLKEITQSHSILEFGALPYRKNEIMDSYATLDSNTKINWKAETEWHKGFEGIVDSYRNSK